MRNVAPSRALVRRSYRLLEIAFVAVTAGIFLTMMGLALIAIPLIGKDSDARAIYDLATELLFLSGVAMGITGVALVIRAVTWKTENDLAKMTGDMLAQYLDDRYTFIRNISKRKLGYIDAVLVGPPGVLVFRIVDVDGDYLNVRQIPEQLEVIANIP